MDQSSSHFHPDNTPKEKFNPETTEIAFDSGAPLPETYGDNRLIILPRDPLWFFAYWEFTPDRLEKLNRDVGVDVWTQGALNLRVYDTTDQVNGLEGSPFFDVEVDKQARQWYVHVHQPGRVYAVDLGLRLRDGRFLSLLRSNRINLPFGHISEKTDSQWMSVGLVTEQIAWENMALMAIGAGSTKGGSAGGDVSNAQAMRWEFLRSVFSASSSRLSGSSAWMTAGTVPEEKKS